MPHIHIPRKVNKDGPPSCCWRYRPALHFSEAIDTSTSHCIVRPA